MTSPLNIQLALEDLLADLHFARKNEQLGRLALLAYCDVKRWAREAGKSDVADMALRMFAEKPCLSKEAFLCGIDQLLGSLQSHESEFQNSRPAMPPIPTGPTGRPVMQPWTDAALG